MNTDNSGNEDDDDVDYDMVTTGTIPMTTYYQFFLFVFLSVTEIVK